MARGLVHAGIPCEAYLLTQSSSCEAPFYARGARGSDSRGHGDAQARKQEGHHDTSEGEDRSPDFFGLGIRLLLYFLATSLPRNQLRRW
jgi:hypothetical protein